MAHGLSRITPLTSSGPNCRATGPTVYAIHVMWILDDRAKRYAHKKIKKEKRRKHARDEEMKVKKTLEKQRRHEKRQKIRDDAEKKFEDSQHPAERKHHLPGPRKC